MYEILYKEAEKNHLDIVCSDLFIVHKNVIKKYHSITNVSEKETLLRNYISLEWTSLVNLLVHNSIYKKYNLKSPTHICYCEDFWLSVRLFYYAKRIAKVNRAFYFYDQTNTTSILHNLSKWHGDDLKCYIETIEFFSQNNCIKQYEKEMSWRVLNAFHFDMFNPDKHKEIICIYPTCHKYILSNPFYIKRQKQIMWLLTHHCRWVVLCFLSLRRLFGRKKII